MNIPKVNTTVVAVREAWTRIEARRASRLSPGGGRAEPLPGVIRIDNYTKQNDGMLTPRQLRRFEHKYNRTLRPLRAVSTLDGGQ